MAKQTVLVSDLSGERLEERDAAVLLVKHNDQRRGDFMLDVSASEVAEIVSKGRRIQRRGRRPGKLTERRSDNGDVHDV